MSDGEYVCLAEAAETAIISQETDVAILRKLLLTCANALRVAGHAKIKITSANEVKRCNACGVVKHVSEFSIYSARRPQPRPSCKLCVRACTARSEARRGLTRTPRTRTPAPLDMSHVTH
jgi:hypothetical protein